MGDLEKQNVVLLGNGEMSLAISSLLHDKARIKIWKREPLERLPAFISDAAIIFFCIPTAPHREIVRAMLPGLGSRPTLVSIAKGLDDHGENVTEIFNGELTDVGRFVTLYGPMISEEILEDKWAFAQISGSTTESMSDILELFEDTKLKLTESRDPIGANWVAVLKNVYAIAFGVSDGLELGDNTRGYLAVAVVDEMTRLVEVLEGQKGTVLGPAGIGDLITTATSLSSSHHELGSRLAIGANYNSKVEGVNTVQMLVNHRNLEFENFRLMNAISRMLERPANTRAIFRDFFASGAQ